MMAVRPEKNRRPIRTNPYLAAKEFAGEVEADNASNIGIKLAGRIPGILAAVNEEVT